MGQARTRAVRRLVVWGGAAAIPLIFLGVFFGWPVTALIARGFLTDGALDLSGFADVLTTPRTWRLLGITLAQGVVGTLVAVALGIPGAYILYRCTFPGRTIARALVTIPFVLPTVVVGVAFRALLAPNGPLGFLNIDGTFTAVVAALVFFNYSVVVRTVGGMWEKIDPRTAEAARSLGASRTRALWTVTLPQLMPAITSAAAVVFLFCATAFGTVMVLGGQGYGTIETEIWMQTVQFLDLRTAAILSILQLTVVALALWVSARARTSRERALTLVSDTTAQRPLNLRQDAAALTITALTGIGLLAWPLLNLLTAAFRDRNGNWTLNNFTALGTTGERNALSVTVWEALYNSLVIAFYATLTALIIGGLVAYVVSRRPTSPTGKNAITWLDALFMLPLGVSAVTVGFGFLITLDRPLGFNLDLRSSGLLVPLAQAVVATPLVVRTVLPVLRAIDPRQHHAAATLGAPPWRVALTIDWPHATRALGLAAGMAFAVSLGEFGATSFLARPDTATLPIVIFRLISKPGAENYGMALAASVILALVTAAIMMLAERLRTTTAGEF
ncbi:ABC transporter permease [Jonesia quinghaiensis]|uniref:ABC transporter permease n=1 Tax=Jonesia quinghaiensis TaxID=262806 RepID=UPI001FE19D61|nr:iron ABC transporter permease [Jonesia quinghaiensis]